MAYEYVDKDAIILGKIRKDFAWQIIKDYKRYPNIMENVAEVEIHFQEDAFGKSEILFLQIERPYQRRPYSPSPFADNVQGAPPC